MQLWGPLCVLHWLRGLCYRHVRRISNGARMQALLTLMEIGIRLCIIQNEADYGRQLSAESETRVDSDVEGAECTVPYNFSEELCRRRQALRVGPQMLRSGCQDIWQVPNVPKRVRRTWQRCPGVLCPHLCEERNLASSSAAVWATLCNMEQASPCGGSHANIPSSTAILARPL